MIKLRALLTELLGEEESQAAIQAHKMGLVGRPYGYFADPHTGKNVARSLNGQLVKIQATPEPASDEEPAKPIETPVDWDAHQKNVADKWHDAAQTPEDQAYADMFHPKGTYV